MSLAVFGQGMGPIMMIGRCLKERVIALKALTIPVSLLCKNCARQ